MRSAISSLFLTLCIIFQAQPAAAINDATVGVPARKCQLLQGFAEQCLADVDDMQDGACVGVAYECLNQGTGPFHQQGCQEILEDCEAAATQAYTDCMRLLDRHGLMDCRNTGEKQ